MKKSIFVILCVLSMMNIQGQTISDYRNIFDYDKGLDLSIQILSSRDSLGGTIQNIVFTSINGVRVTGSLVLPKQKIKEFPVVIFLPDMLQNKQLFLSQAIDLTSQAFASLLLDSPLDRPEDNKYGFRNYTDPRKEFSAYRQSVFDIRRAIDFLEQHERIDQNRIAFVGSGTGAMTGAIVSGVENRITSYILMNNYYSFISELKNSDEPAVVKARDLLEPDQETAYEAVLKMIEPQNYLPYHRNSYIFFQFVQSNNMAGKDFFQLTKEPKRQKIYKTNPGTLSTFEEAVKDRESWFINHL